MTPGKTSKAREGASARSLARLLAVQALYLIRMTPGATPEQVVDEVAHLHIGAREGVPLITEVDRKFFADLVRGATERGDDIRALLRKVLTGEWKYERLEAILAVILEAGIYELLARPDVPRAVVIDEYVEITHDFYGGGEPGFVNGILDEIAKSVRA